MPLGGLLEVGRLGSCSAQTSVRRDIMYGLLCESLHDFIKESYGDDVWKLVRERADVRLHSFVTHQVQWCSNTLALKSDISAICLFIWVNLSSVIMMMCVSAGVQWECDSAHRKGSQRSDRHTLQWTHELLGCLLPGVCWEVWLWQDPQGEKKISVNHSVVFWEMCDRVLKYSVNHENYPKTTILQVEEYSF